METIQNNAFGSRLRQIRKEAGFSQAALAKELGYGNQQITRYEGGTEPPIDFWKKFSDRFGINIRWLIFGEGQVKAETADGSAHAFEILRPYVEAHIGEIAREITIIEDDIQMLRIHPDRADEKDISAVIERKQKLLRNELKYFEKVLDDIERAKK